MKLSKAQQALHWRLMKQAMPLLMPGRETWTKLEENEQRHALYVSALGVDKSLTAMNDDDFDAVLGELKAIINPSDLVAQLRKLNMRKTRRLYRIRQLSPGPEYLQEIINTMNAEGALKTFDLEQMGIPELGKVVVALRKQEARECRAGAPPAASFCEKLSRSMSDRRRHHRLVGGKMPSHPF